MFAGQVTNLALRIAQQVSKYRGRWFADTVEKSVDVVHRALNNSDFNMARNGEMRVLSKLAEIHPKCIFDVGANVGEWSLKVSAMLPECAIHAFEIVPATYESLAKNTKRMPNIVLNNVGLSDKKETIRVQIGTDSSTATGCEVAALHFGETYYQHALQCQTETGAEYVKQRLIEEIDFLKSDVEGMDYKVIKGFGNDIKKIKIVQFEYGRFNIASHVLLCDFYSYFKEKGFIVGKIFPNSVAFADYHSSMENFHGSNYLAVRNDEKGLLNRLARFGS